MVNFNRQLILASMSPRRNEILKEAGFRFLRLSNNFLEEIPDNLPVREVARYMAEKKSEFNAKVLTDEVLLTADTIVVVDDQILVKPLSYKEGFGMLRLLSDKNHEVITGVCLRSKEKVVSFDETTLVHFRHLSDEEIDYYLKEYLPYDKAGAYGIQEWLGMIGIDRIEGSYFNVVGLPIHRIHEELKQFNDI